MENKSIPQPQNSLGFFGIIRESFKTATRNRKLQLPILLVAFLSFSQLDFAQKYVLEPVARDFVSQLAKHPNIVHDFTYSIDRSTYVGALDDVREILLVKLLIMAISGIITLGFLVATVSSSYEAYTAKLLDQNDIMLKLRESWKRPIVTTFYMVLLTLGIVFFYLISICIASILALNPLGAMFLGAITLSIPVCYFYISALWMVSLIVSVLEEGSGGLKAIGRASELMKGKRIHASLMMFLFAIVYGFGVMMAIYLTSYNRSLSTELAFTIPVTNAFTVLLKLFMFVVYTVFYHEWKISHGEKEGKGMYLPINAAGEV